MVAAPISALAQNALANPPAQTQQASSGINFSFHDILNIINPLQHIPIVGTLYRAITGDTIKPFDKIAGDTLYGGVMGFVSSMADTVFQAVTGKDFGDTVLGFLTGDGDNKTAVAANTATSPAQAAPASFTSTGAEAPAAATPARVVPDTSVSPPDLSALWQALNRTGIDPDTAQRAAYAYRRAVGLVQQPIPAIAAQPMS